MQCMVWVYVRLPPPVVLRRLQCKHRILLVVHLTIWEDYKTLREGIHARNKTPHAVKLLYRYARNFISHLR